MSDGAPQARDISPGRSALPVALVAVRVLVLALVVLGAGRRPVTDVQILQVERIATSPATPYRNFPVTTMPLETATDRTIGGDGASATVARIALLAFIADLAAASAIAWGWGRRPAIVYLLLGLPLLSFIYLRFDLVSVALAAWAIAWTKHRGEALGGAALGLAVMAKLWPLALAPVLVIRRAWRPAVAGFAVVVVVLGAAWYLTGGPKGPFQVLTSAGVRGWHVQSTVGSVLWIAGRGIPVVEADALRVGLAAPWMKGLLFLGLLVCEVAIWRRAAGTDRDPSGGAALAAVVALTVFSPRSSLQYAAWFLPWTALAFEGDDGEERTATIAAVAVTLTGLIALAWPDQIVVPSAWMKLLVLARNAAAVGVLISWFAASRTRAPGQAAGAPVSA
jgi:Glycosyltransferase family 87